MDSSIDRKTYSKLAQLEKALKNKSDIKIIKNILEKEGDINYAIPNSSIFRFSKPNLIGYTALHFAIHKSDAFVYLLNHGADFIKKNEAGQTALHMLIEQHKYFKEPVDNLLINSVLSAHVATNNFFNPCNKDGLSHFHVACMTNNSKAVEFFLDNGISVDESVGTASAFSPGYTPLHFAAMCTNTNVAEILLAYGAGMHILDASGKTALHVLIERRMQMFESVGEAMSEEEGSYKKLQVQIQENDKLINMLLENMSNDNESLDCIGLSNFHVACTLQDTSVAENLADRVTDINHCVNKDSKLWPGYTALHFAAHFSSSTVEMLMKKGANIELKDSKGMTPLDICIERYKIADICSIISLNAKWKDILFSDGTTTLVSFISTLTDDSCFRKFIKNSIKDINMQIPLESSLWPGYTPLHLAVLFAERSKLLFSEEKDQEKMHFTIIRFCLSQGADLSVQDSRGCTALHLAFRLNKMKVVRTLHENSRQIPNVSDEDNLSHLHIVCAVICKKFRFKKCTLDNSVMNAVYKGSSPINSVNPGSTPLHVCMSERQNPIDDFILDGIKTLLKHGADFSIKDANGLTPIHWLMDRVSFSAWYRITAKDLLKKVPNDCVAEEYGLNYLHVACLANCHAGVKRFLSKGADVNLAIKYTKQHDNGSLSFLSPYDKYTPLHFASSHFLSITKLLIKHGANVFAEKADGSIPASYPTILNIFISKLWYDFELQNRLRREFGWTKLHIACYFEKVQQFENIVKAELADINAQIFSNSPIWKGYTPLHVMMDRSRYHHDYMDKESNFISVLLENGADVTKLNDQQNTPLSMNFEPYRYSNEVKHARLMMKHHKNFNVNPVNNQGVSHFHVACYLNDVDAVKGFLSNGADVNRPIDFFSSSCAGHTPLHLASELPVIEILIDHGADIHAEDVDGFTPLHKAVANYPFEENVIKKMIEISAEINTPNFNGITPFENAISEYGMSSEKLDFFIKQGFLVNSCNTVTGIGYASLILGKHYISSDLDSRRISVMEMMMNEKSTNIFGRTTLHHLVTGSSYSSKNYVVLFEKLFKIGHDIDEQDSEGKTALHLAVQFQKNSAIEGLLECGADINVVDINGRSALRYSKSNDELAVHASRLVSLKLDLNQSDMDSVKNAREYVQDTASRPEFFEQVDLCKEIELGVRTMHLHDFLSETNAVTFYLYLNQSERSRMAEYFETLNNDKRLRDIRSFLKLQYRKALKRLELHSPAINSLRCLLGFNLPNLCVENIFQYLPNSDLKNMIVAGAETKDA